MPVARDRLFHYVQDKVNELELRDVRISQIEAASELLWENNYHPNRLILTSEQIDYIDDNLGYFIRSLNEERLNEQEWRNFVRGLRTLTVRYAYQFYHNQIITSLIGAEISDHVQQEMINRGFRLTDQQLNILDKIIYTDDIDTYYQFAGVITYYEMDKLIYKQYINQNSPYIRLLRDTGDRRRNRDNIYRYFDELHKTLDSILTNVEDPDYPRMWIRVTINLVNSIRRKVETSPLIEYYLDQLVNPRVSQIVKFEGKI